MTKEVQIIVEKDYSSYVPLIEVIRTCQLDENGEAIYGVGDPCLIKAIVTSKSSLNDRMKKELIMHVKSMYFRKTQGCKFDVDLTLAEK